MHHRSWRPGFHLPPHKGWLNDPNGLCQMNGEYHVFYQYGPDWPEDDLKYWGHYVSRDLVNWEDLGCALSPDHVADRNGVFSGCAVPWTDRATGERAMRLYYTGNVITEGDKIHTGREANEILVESRDGRSFSAKHVLLTNDDYPAEATRHVRDPKVWIEDGAWHMLLGMRTQEDVGCVLVYDSVDGVEWHHRSTIRPLAPFGYMWECPNLVQLGGREFLAVCPQGVESEKYRFQNLWQAGYIPLGSRVLDAAVADQDAFVEWDHGHDFYAPQIFDDESGRTLLVGWMGTFDKHYTAAPDGLDWCHCLTVPRELTLDEDGMLLQNPVTELESLRGAMHEVLPIEKNLLPGRRADVVLEGIEGDGSIAFDGDLRIAFAGDLVTVSFADEDAAAGRTERTFPLDRATTANDLRVLVDASAVEVYVNGGRTVFSTRWFPTAENLTIETDLASATAVAWEMGAGAIG